MDITPTFITYTGKKIKLNRFTYTNINWDQTTHSLFHLTIFCEYFPTVLNNL